PREVATDDRDTLRVNRAAELRLVLDVDDAFTSERDDGGDPHRLAELDVACRIHGQAVDDADAEALGVERHLTTKRQLADVARRGAGALAPFSPRDLDVLRGDDAALGDLRRAERARDLRRRPSLRPVVVSRGARRRERAGEGGGLLERREGDAHLLP